MQSIHVFSLDNKLYVGTTNLSGSEIWRTVDPIIVTVNFPSKYILIPLLLLCFTAAFIAGHAMLL